MKNFASTRADAAGGAVALLSRRENSKFPVRFEHRMVSTAGLRFHCVVGGAGPSIILVAGFPQSCYAWRRVMPLLAPHSQVIAIDLPGQGDSDKPVDGYDTATAARRVNTLLKALGVGRHLYVGHDVGPGWVIPMPTRSSRS